MVGKTRSIANGRRQAQADPQPGSIVAQQQLRLVQFGDRHDQAQAKSVAGRAAAAVETEEALQHLTTSGLGHAGAGIGDRDLDKSTRQIIPL